MNNLYEASNQWANRPVDERFETLDQAYNFAVDIKTHSKTSTIALKNLSCATDYNGELIIKGSAAQAKLTFNGMSDLCRHVNAPARYLRQLSPELAAVNLNHGLAHSNHSGMMLLRESQQGYQMRCINGVDYGRIWNCELLGRTIDLQSHGWAIPPARPARNNQPGIRLATEDDVIKSAHKNLGIKLGDPIAPAGIYVSDHDMFVFMIYDHNPIDDGSGTPMYRGAFFSNSEVGKGKLSITTFNYAGVCGNHIVWNVENVAKIDIVHRKHAKLRFNTAQMVSTLTKYANTPASNTEDKIKQAKTKLLGKDKEELLDLVFGKRKFLTLTDAENAYNYAISEADTHNSGDPLSAWGFAAGITAYSQTKSYGDERVSLDRAAGKVLDMVF